jgi:hypothetical protein
MPQPLYPQEESPWYPMDRRLGGPIEILFCNAQYRPTRHTTMTTNFTIFLQWLVIIMLNKKSPAFIEPEGS